MTHGMTSRPWRSTSSNQPLWGRVLEHVPIREAHVLARAEQSAPCPANTYLVEYCCSEESKLMEEWFAQGGQGESACMSRGDASDPKFVLEVTSRCQKELDKGKHVRTHISLPCSPWSKMAGITASKSEQDQKNRLEKQNHS